MSLSDGASPYLFRRDGSEITLVTDCSGLETPSLALRQLGVPHRLLAASDVKESLRRGIVSNFAPVAMHDEAAVDSSPLPGTTDLYISGPHCQDFSLAGARWGGWASWSSL